MSILIVDDSPDSRLLLRTGLEGRYVCHIASGGDEALAVLSSETVLNGESVDLALIDVLMPGMNGSTLFQKVKDHDPDMAVIFVTAVDDLDLAVEHLKNGAYDYLVKPVTWEHLQRVVAEALDKRAANLREKRDGNSLREQIHRQSEELDARMRELSSLRRMLRADVRDERQHQLANTSLQESLKMRVSQFLNSRVQPKLLVLQQKLVECQALAAFEPERVNSLLEEIRTDLRHIQDDDIRWMSHELYPSIIMEEQRLGPFGKYRMICGRKSKRCSLRRTRPNPPGAGVPTNGKCSTGLSFECVAAANGTICPRNWVVTAPSTALSSVG